MNLSFLKQKPCSLQFPCYETSPIVLYILSSSSITLCKISLIFYSNLNFQLLLSVNVYNAVGSSDGFPRHSILLQTFFFFSSIQ